MPGTYLENIRFLSEQDIIGGVEILFFLYDDDTRASFLRELPAIREFSDARFVFTAHLPDNLRDEHESLVELLSPMVKHFIVHPAEDAQEQARYLKRWQERYGSQRFLLENTYTGRLEAILEQLGDDTPLCMDTAHLLVNGESPAAFARRYGGRIREVHLNGLSAPRSGGAAGAHNPPRIEDEWLTELAPFLRNFSGIVNIEVFSWRGVQDSIDSLRRLLD
jgi:sugar phosphate isomerase/epimerase